MVDQSNVLLAPFVTKLLLSRLLQLVLLLYPLDQRPSFLFSPYESALETARNEWNKAHLVKLLGDGLSRLS